MFQLGMGSVTGAVKVRAKIYTTVLMQSVIKAKIQKHFGDVYISHPRSI